MQIGRKEAVLRAETRKKAQIRSTSSYNANKNSALFATGNNTLN